MEIISFFKFNFILFFKFKKKIISLSYYKFSFVNLELSQLQTH